MAKYKVAFTLEDLPGFEGFTSAATFEIGLEDILVRIVAPTFDTEIVPLSLTVRKARG